MKTNYHPAVLLFAVILAAATTARGADPVCHRQENLEAWLAVNANAWQKQLAAYPGYQHPGPMAVCLAAGGGPRSDGERIYLPPLSPDVELLSLAHEYVHLAFRHHPATRNEAFVEQRARALLLGEEAQ
jgi:uncharacterized protein YfaQ (DUF2300 family)